MALNSGTFTTINNIRGTSDAIDPAYSTNNIAINTAWGTNSSIDPGLLFIEHTSTNAIPKAVLLLLEIVMGVSETLNRKILCFFAPCLPVCCALSVDF